MRVCGDVNGLAIIPCGRSNGDQSNTGCLGLSDESVVDAPAPGAQCLEQTITPQMQAHASLLVQQITELANTDPVLANAALADKNDHSQIPVCTLFATSATPPDTRPGG